MKKLILKKERKNETRSNKLLLERLEKRGMKINTAEEMKLYITDSALIRRGGSRKERQWSVQGREKVQWSKVYRTGRKDSDCALNPLSGKV